MEAGKPPDLIGEEPAGRARSRLIRWTAIGAVAVIAAFVVFASQRGDSDGGGPLNAIAEAAEKTQQEPGGRAEIRALISVPDHSAVPMTGRMVYGMDRSRALMTVPNPKSGDLVKMETISDGEVMYFRSAMLGPLPGGAEWMAVDMSTGDDAPLPSNMDPQGELAILRAFGGDVEKVGHEAVRGVETTRYRGTEGDTPLLLEAWIDSHKRVRRMRIANSAPGDQADGSGGVDMRMDFLDFGVEPQIDVPDSDEVFDATELAHSSE